MAHLEDAWKFVNSVRNRISSNDEIDVIVEKLKDIECRKVKEPDSVASNIINAIDNILESGCQGDAQLEAIVVGCCAWLIILQEQKYSPAFTAAEFNLFVSKLLRLVENRNSNVRYGVFISFNCLFVNYPEYSRDIFIQMFHMKHHNLVKYIQMNEISIKEKYIVIRSIHSSLSTLKGVELTDEYDEILFALATSIIDILDDKNMVKSTGIRHDEFILRCLEILNIAIEYHPTFVHVYAANLFDMFKMYASYGVSKGDLLPSADCEYPVRIPPLMIDSYEEAIGGKHLKTVKFKGKMSKIYKAKKQKDSKRNLPNGELICNQRIFNTDAIHIFKLEDILNDLDNVSGIPDTRIEEILIRLTSIHQIGRMGRTLEPKNLYSYWSKLFPCTNRKDDLLSIARYETNVKCRQELLLTCTQLLYLFKEYLQQAEVNQSLCPSTYTPSSINLGISIKTTFMQLQNILLNEKSVLVIAQTLKCISSLIQVTSFQEFNSSIIEGFVSLIRPYVNHHDSTVQIGCLMVFEVLLLPSDLTAELTELLGFAGKLSGKGSMDNKSEVNAIKPIDLEQNQSNSCSTNNVDQNWLLLAIMNLLSKDHGSSVQIQSLKVVIALSSHFYLVKPFLEELTRILIHKLNDQSSDIRLYAMRSLEAIFLQINNYLRTDNNVHDMSLNTFISDMFSTEIIQRLLLHITKFQNEETNVKICLIGSLSNIGEIVFDRFPHKVQIEILQILTSVSNDPAEDPVVRAEAIRTLSIYSLFLSLMNDFVFIENIIETIMRFSSNNLVTHIKVFWSLANVSEAVLNTSKHDDQVEKKICDDLLSRVINKCIVACTDHDKIRCNAARSLGNILRLFKINEYGTTEDRYKSQRYEIFKEGFNALLVCLQSSTNSKVKWNACYAISYIIAELNESTFIDLKMDTILFPLLCQIVTRNTNFKVRISAAFAISCISVRTCFGKHFQTFWCTLLQALQLSYQLDNYHEYNHRDNLQEQLCLTIGHLLKCSTNEDLIMMKRCLQLYIENIRDVWIRVVNRMIPEKAASFLYCVAHLNEFKHQSHLSEEQIEAAKFLYRVFNID